MTFSTALQWSLSIQGLTMMWLMGNGNKWGPVLGLFGQVLWFIYLFNTKQWGLAPSIIAFTFVHARNSWKLWKKP